jgi:two-component system sensor histidine kinase YesM
MASNKRVSFFHSFSFNLFITFSAVMLITLFSITYFLTKEVTKSLIHQELQLNKYIVDKTAEYFDEKIISAKNVIQDIYYSDMEMQIILKSMLNVETEFIQLEYIEQKEKFDKLFISTLYNDKDIVDIIIMGKGNDKSYVFSKKWSTINLEDSNPKYPWAVDIIKNQNSLIVVPSYKPLHSTDGPPLTYSVVTSIFDTNFTKGTIGAILINFDTEMIKNAYKMYENDIKGEILLFDKNGGVIFDSSGQYYDKKPPYFNEIQEETESKLLIDGNIISISHTKSLDMTVVCISAEQELFHSIDSFKKKSNLMLLLAILLILIIFYKASQFLSSRINTMNHVIKKVQEGDLEARIPIGQQKRDELAIIAINFNNMCQKLSDYINRIYISEIKLREAEFMSLQRKINPHFIFNTLEIIRVKAVLQKNHDVSSMILLLSNLFRRSIRNNDIVVSIQDEIDYCKDYLELNNIRFQERMRVDYNLDKQIMKKGVLKLILQPLVENIMVHGISDKSDFFQILIEGYLEGDNIIIKIEDSGIGINPTRLTDIKKILNDKKNKNNNSHIGLKNVNDRLKIVFGNDYGLSIESTENVKTIVKVKFPAMTVPEMNKYIKKS